MVKAFRRRLSKYLHGQTRPKALKRQEFSDGVIGEQTETGEFIIYFDEHRWELQHPPRSEVQSPQIWEIGKNYWPEGSNRVSKIQCSWVKSMDELLHAAQQHLQLITHWYREEIS